MLGAALKPVPLDLLATAVIFVAKLVILWYVVTVQSWRASSAKTRFVGTMKEKLSYHLAL